MIGSSQNLQKLTSRLDDMSNVFEEYKACRLDANRIGGSKQYQQLELHPIQSVDEGEDSYEKLKEIL